VKPPPPERTLVVTPLPPSAGHETTLIVAPLPRPDTEGVPVAELDVRVGSYPVPAPPK